MICVRTALHTVFSSLACQLVFARTSVHLSFAIHASILYSDCVAFNSYPSIGLACTTWNQHAVDSMEVGGKLSAELTHLTWPYWHLLILQSRAGMYVAQCAPMTTWLRHSATPGRVIALLLCNFWAAHDRQMTRQNE